MATKPKLALRDLFWLVLVAGLALAWWIDHRRGQQVLNDLRMQWLHSIPPPYPKESVVIEILEEQRDKLEAENAELRAKLEASGE